MLTEAVQWRLRDRAFDGGVNPRVPAPVTLTVVLVGHAEGNQPRSRAELNTKGAAHAKLNLEPALLADNHRILRQSLWLFGEYLAAITDGRMALRTEFLSLPNLTVPVSVNERDGRLHAGLAGGANAKVWKSVPEAVKARTDLWWIVYPSAVPEGPPDFAGAEFVTGGMGSGPDGHSACFVVDDRWLTRKPPHLGNGPYADHEREAYLPQWLQHEFFHHLFGLYPQFGLEKKSHQWFDRSTWPKDFQGVLEPDYYAEALHRVLIPNAQPPLYVKLRHAAPDPETIRLGLGTLEGLYRHEPMGNDWHEGRLSREGAAKANGGFTLRWTNRQGKTWRVSSVPGSLTLPTGPDNPYAKREDEKKHKFLVELKTDGNGSYLPEAAGFWFDSSFYKKVGP